MKKALNVLIVLTIIVCVFAIIGIVLFKKEPTIPVPVDSQPNNFSQEVVPITPDHEGKGA